MFDRRSGSSRFAAGLPQSVDIGLQADPSAHTKREMHYYFQDTYKCLQSYAIRGYSV